MIVNAPHASRDIFIVPITSRLHDLLPGEFVIADTKSAGLNVVSAIKRGIYTIDSGLILKILGSLHVNDAQQLEDSLRYWLALPTNTSDSA